MSSCYTYLYPHFKILSHLSYYFETFGRRLNVLNTVHYINFIHFLGEKTVIAMSSNRNFSSFGLVTHTGIVRYKVPQISFHFIVWFLYKNN